MAYLGVNEVPFAGIQNQTFMTLCVHMHDYYLFHKCVGATEIHCKLFNTGDRYRNDFLFHFTFTLQE